MAKRSVKKARSKSPQRAPSQSHSVLPEQHKAVLASELPLMRDNTLKTLWVDTMEIGTRGDIPVSTISFCCVVGSEYRLEVARLQTSTEHLKRVVDAVCRNLDYYPTKTAVARARRKKAKKPAKP